MEAAIASVRDEAKKAGYQVIIDTDKLTSSNDYQAVDRDLEYRNTNSIEFTQDVTDIAKELLQYALMYHSNPTECYMVVHIEYIGGHNARFHIELRIEHTGSFINHWYVHNPIV